MTKDVNNVVDQNCDSKVKVSNEYKCDVCSDNAYKTIDT